MSKKRTVVKFLLLMSFPLCAMEKPNKNQQFNFSLPAHLQLYAQSHAKRMFFTTTDKAVIVAQLLSENSFRGLFLRILFKLALKNSKTVLINGGRSLMYTSSAGLMLFKQLPLLGQLCAGMPIPLIFGFLYLRYVMNDLYQTMARQGADIVNNGRAIEDLRQTVIEGNSEIKKEIHQVHEEIDVFAQKNEKEHDCLFKKGAKIQRQLTRGFAQQQINMKRGNKQLQKLGKKIAELHAQIKSMNAQMQSGQIKQSEQLALLGDLITTNTQLHQVQAEMTQVHMELSQKIYTAVNPNDRPPALEDSSSSISSTNENSFSEEKELDRKLKDKPKKKK